MSKNKALVFILGLCCALSISIMPLDVFADDLDMFEDIPIENTDNTDNVAKIDDDNKIVVDEQKNETKNESVKQEVKAEKKINNDTPEERETWLESLISKGQSEFFKSNSDDNKINFNISKKDAKKVIQNRRSNAATFDISGIKLRMSPKKVAEILEPLGYRRITQERRIPNFIKWRSEELCRINGVIGFERLAGCARAIAQKNGFEYIAYETYNRQATRESLEIYYTSTFTDNLSHHILYKSNVPYSTSRASHNVYINNLKIYDFWRRIDMRYGQPDNTSEIKWGLGGKKPYMQAATGRLELVDPLLMDLDTSRMINEDSRLANTPYYSF